jgi:hypothetical protein
MDLVVPPGFIRRGLVAVEDACACSETGAGANRCEKLGDGIRQGLMEDVLRRYWIFGYHAFMNPTISFTGTSYPLYVIGPAPTPPGTISTSMPPSGGLSNV